MSLDAQGLEVQHNREKNRFEIDLGNEQVALIDYRMQGDDVYVLIHTEVPPEYRGRGIAERMAEAALETAKTEGRQVVPECPFVRKYIRRNPQYQSLAAKGE